MTTSLVVEGLSVSREKGRPHEAVRTLTVSAEGIEGDRHGGPGLRQVSLMHEADVRGHFPETGANLAGRGQENILLGGGALENVHILDTLELDDAVLEITQIGARVNRSGAALCGGDSTCLLSDFGVFARVRHGGTITAGNAVRHRRRRLRAHVITVSDRASRGVYEDRSGPAVRALLDDWAGAREWDLAVESRIISDDRDAIVAALRAACDGAADLIVTTGGTGVAPRDITPDVVMEQADRLVPGIMDYIRMKYGATLPTALTSRSVAALIGTSLVYTLPGSARAIPEYLEEIFKTMEHMLILLKGLDAH